MAQYKTHHPLRVGVQLHPQHTCYQDFAEAVHHAESIGADSIWNWDHFFPLWGDTQGNHFESWTLLTAMATLTTHARIGCLVTCNSYRNPALLAAMAKTVDHVSNGRLILGIGAGWCEHEYQEYGYEFGTARSRLTALEEALPIILQRWKVDAPKPVRGTIPILIGGGGEKKTLRMTAQYADMWHGFGDVPTISHKMLVLNQWCVEVGRDPSEIERFVTVRNDISYDELDDYIEAGITHMVLDLETPWNFDPLQRMVNWRDTKQAQYLTPELLHTVPK